MQRERGASECESVAAGELKRVRESALIKTNTYLNYAGSCWLKLHLRHHNSDLLPLLAYTPLTASGAHLQINALKACAPTLPNLTKFRCLLAPQPKWCASHTGKRTNTHTDFPAIAFNVCRWRRRFYRTLTFSRVCTVSLCASSVNFGWERREPRGCDDLPPACLTIYHAACSYMYELS